MRRIIIPFTFKGIVAFPEDFCKNNLSYVSRFVVFFLGTYSAIIPVQPHQVFGYHGSTILFPRIHYLDWQPWMNVLETTKGEMVTVPFKNSYWIIPGKFLAGFYPGSEVKEESQQKLRSLLDHGIRYMINLMEPHEINWFGKPFVHYACEMRAIAASLGYMVTCERMPIRDASVPSTDEMRSILDRIDQCISNNTPVYVHCLGGRGRTGTVVGCFLARHGIASGGNALRLIQTLRKETGDSRYSSPEFPEQYGMIVSWKEGQ
jgi:hypothetical protein